MSIVMSNGMLGTGLLLLFLQDAQTKTMNAIKINRNFISVSRFANV